MGTEAAVGVGAQIVDIHLSASELCGLLPEAQHLLRPQVAGQLDAIALTVETAATLLIEAGGADAGHAGQAGSQRRPLGIADQAGLNVEVVGEPTGDEQTAVAIEDAAAHRLTGHQSDAVLIGAGAVLGALHQLQPGQAQPHRRGEQHHDRQQVRRLALHASVAIRGGQQGHRLNPGD